MLFSKKIIVTALLYSQTHQLIVLHNYIFLKPMCNKNSFTSISSRETSVRVAYLGLIVEKVYYMDFQVLRSSANVTTFPVYNYLLSNVSSANWICVSFVFFFVYNKMFPLDFAVRALPRATVLCLDQHWNDSTTWHQMRYFVGCTTQINQTSGSLRLNCVFGEI